MRPSPPVSRLHASAPPYGRGRGWRTLRVGPRGQRRDGIVQLACQLLRLLLRLAAVADERRARRVEGPQLGGLEGQLHHQPVVGGAEGPAGKGTGGGAVCVCARACVCVCVCVRVRVRVCVGGVGAGRGGGRRTVAALSAQAEARPGPGRVQGMGAVGRLPTSLKLQEQPDPLPPGAAHPAALLPIGRPCMQPGTGRSVAEQHPPARDVQGRLHVTCQHLHRRLAGRGGEVCVVGEEQHLHRGSGVVWCGWVVGGEAAEGGWRALACGRPVARRGTCQGGSLRRAGKHLPAVAL